MKHKLREPFSINVRFVPRLRCDGEIVRMLIEQDGIEVQLTKEQVQALVQQINARIGP